MAATEYEEFRVGQEILDVSLLDYNMIHMLTTQKEAAQHPESLWMSIALTILIDMHLIRTWNG